MEGNIKANSFVYDDVTVFFFSKALFTDVWVIELDGIVNEGSMVLISYAPIDTKPKKGSTVSFIMYDTAKGLSCVSTISDDSSVKIEYMRGAYKPIYEYDIFFGLKITPKYAIACSVTVYSKNS